MADPKDLELLALISDLHPLGGPIDRSDLVAALHGAGGPPPTEAEQAIDRLEAAGLLECGWARPLDDDQPDRPERRVEPRQEIRLVDGAAAPERRTSA